MEILGQKFCRHCQEPLDYIDKCCWRCGTPFDKNDPGTYLFRPHFLRWKFWLPGLSLAMISGVVSYATCLTFGNNQLALALFVAVPISVGAIIGYSTRGRILWLVALVTLAVAGIVLSLVVFQLSGLFCGILLGFIFFVPVMGGALLGYVLRMVLKSTKWDQRWFLPIILFVLFPYGVQAIENALPRPRELATIRTRLHVRATPESAFQAIMFYEQVDRDPPWLLNLALPKPSRAEGSKEKVGNVVRCIYDRGWLTKKITERKENRWLAFDVVEQHLHFEHDVTLVDGSFEIEPANRGGQPGTDIVLTTRYIRHCYPRWLWLPIEEKVVHTLHKHVLAGMQRQAEQSPMPKSSPPEAPRYRPNAEPSAGSTLASRTQSRP